MRKQIVIRNTAMAARNEKKSQLSASLNGKTIAELKMPELLSLVEYMAREQNLVDESGRLMLPHSAQLEDFA
jgi:hypothetical protein